MLSTKVSIALQGTGSSSYQRKIMIRACSHTITQQKILSLGHTRTFAEKNQAQHIIRQKKHQSFPLYISSIAAKRTLGHVVSLCDFTVVSPFPPTVVPAHLHQNPSNSLFNARSSNFCKKELVIILFLPLVYLLSCVTHSKRKC